MKKQFLKKTFLAIAAIAIVGSTTFVACKKGSNSSSSSESTMSTKIDLATFQTNFINNADGTKSVFFSEPEDITVNADRAKLFGYKDLVLSAGIYEIKTGINGLSSLILKVKEGIKTNPPLQTEIGIYITKRVKDKCGTNRAGPFYCLCGIGFNCGLVSSLIPIQNEEPSFVESIQDSNGNSFIKINFKNANIDWQAKETGL